MSHVRETTHVPCTGNYPYTHLHTLKFHDVLESDIVKKGIAIVKSTANKNSYDSFDDRKRHTQAKVTIVINAATTRLGNMLSKIKVVIKGNS